MRTPLIVVLACQILRNIEYFLFQIKFRQLNAIIIPPFPIHKNCFRFHNSQL